MKFIRDGQGKLKGQIVESGNVVYVRDGHGQHKGLYIKTADKTFDGKGRFAGSGDQLMRLLDK